MEKRKKNQTIAMSLVVIFIITVSIITLCYEQIPAGDPYPTIENNIGNLSIINVGSLDRTVKTQFGYVVKDCMNEWDEHKGYGEEFLDFVKKRYNEKYGYQGVDLSSIKIQEVKKN